MANLKRKLTDSGTYIKDINFAIRGLVLSFKFFVQSFIIIPSVFIVCYLLYSSDFILKELADLILAHSFDEWKIAWYNLGYMALILLFVLKVLMAYYKTDVRTES